MSMNVWVSDPQIMRVPFLTGFRMKKLLIAVASAVVPLFAQAQAAHVVVVRPFLSFGVTGGGDTFDRFRYSNGQTKSVKAGGLVQFSGGVDIAFESPFSVQASLGYHTDAANGWDGDYTFSRYPVELLGHWRLNDQFRIGAGVRKALNAKIETGGSLAGGNASFKSSTGYIVEGEYFVLRNLGLKLRFVTEKYTDKAAPRPEFDGDHIGFFGSWYFR
jgi:opacity protein-like surface antigen